VGLQDVIYGKDYMPDGDLMVDIARITVMINWYQNAREQMNYHELKECPEDILDNPTSFNRWIEEKKKLERDKNKLKK